MYLKTVFPIVNDVTYINPFAIDKPCTLDKIDKLEFGIKILIDKS